MLPGCRGQKNPTPAVNKLTALSPRAAVEMQQPTPPCVQPALPAPNIVPADCPGGNSPQLLSPQLFTAALTPYIGEHEISHRTSNRRRIHTKETKSPTAGSKTDPARPWFCLQLLPAKLQWKSPEDLGAVYPYINFIMQLAVVLSNVFV